MGRKIIVYIYIKYIFGWLNLGRDFVRIQNNMKLSFCIMLLMKFLVFRVLLESRRLGNLAWDFFFLGGKGGLIFGPGIFVGFVGNAMDFFCVLTFTPIRSSPSLEIHNAFPSPGSALS